MLEIKLIPNWDEKLARHNNSKSPDIVNIYKNSRSHEKNLLIHQLKSKTPGTILVSGHRGVGKTTLVQRALDEIEDNNIIDIKINAPEFLSNMDDKYFLERQYLIRIIITKLYKRFSDLEEGNRNIKEKIEQLYNKATAANFKLTTDNINISEFNLKNEITKELKFQIPNLLKFIGALSLAIYSLVLSSSFTDPHMTLFFKVIAVIAGGFYPFKIFYNISNISVSSNSQIQTETARELFEHDNSFPILIDELENFHSICHRENIKIVYVIDELDKLDGFERVGSKTILSSIFNNLKNFFTLSSAGFLFITDEGEYLKYLGLIQKGSREENYTYFDMKIFIPRPSWNEISSYLSEIIVNEEESDYEFFKHAVCYESKNDFFDLKNEIRSLITRYDNNNPVIELNEEKLTEFKKKAFIHSAYEKIYNEKYKSHFPKKYTSNERILKALELLAVKVFESRFSNHEIYILEDQKMDDDELSAQADLINVLIRYDFVSFVSMKHEINRGAVNFPVRSIKYFNNSIDKLVDKLDIRSTLEEQFICEYQQFEGLIKEMCVALRVIFAPNKNFKIESAISLTLVDQYRSTLSHFGIQIPQFTTQVKLYLGLMKDSPEGVEPDILKSNKQSLNAELNQFLSSCFIALTVALQKRLERIQPCDVFTVGNYSYNSHLNKLPNEVKEKLKINRHQIIMRSDYKKILVVFSYENADIFQKQKDLIDELKDNFMFIAISSSSSKATNCETIYTGDNSNIPNLKKIIQHLDGWYH